MSAPIWKTKSILKPGLVFHLTDYKWKDGLLKQAVEGINPWMSEFKFAID